MATSAAFIDLDEGAAPATPPAGKVRIYSKTDGLTYSKDDAGSETGMAGGSGDVATDAIFDAKGDLPVGTGSNTAQKLTAGANGTILVADSAQTTGLVWTAPQCAAYTRSSANYSTNSTSFVDVDGTNLALTITTGARRVRVGLIGTALTPASANAQTSFDIDIDGARVGGTEGYVCFRQVGDTTQRHWNASFVYLTDVLTAASHTFKLQWKVSAGTATLIGSSADRLMRFYVEETFFTT